MWLNNTYLKLLPEIAFVDGYPHILTCKYHGVGCDLINIHHWRCRNNIPSPLYDQIFHAFVKPRTVNHMKVGYNYTGYQMVDQSSSCKVLDTINVSSVVKTDRGSILIQ